MLVEGPLNNLRASMMAFPRAKKYVNDRRQPRWNGPAQESQKIPPAAPPADGPDRIGGPHRPHYLPAAMSQHLPGYAGAAFIPGPMMAHPGMTPIPPGGDGSQEQFGAGWTPSSQVSCTCCVFGVERLCGS